MTTATSAKRNSMLLMALCAIMWSLGGIFIKLISWNPLLICGVRSVIAALILGGYMFVTRTPVNFNIFFWCRDRAFHILHILRLRQQADDCGQRYSTPVYCTDFYSSDVGIFIQAEIT